MFLILLFALLCTAPLSLVKWRLTNDYDDAVKSDHKAVIAYNGPPIPAYNKRRESRVFRKRRRHSMLSSWSMYRRWRSSWWATWTCRATSTTCTQSWRTCWIISIQSDKRCHQPTRASSHRPSKPCCDARTGWWESDAQKKLARPGITASWPTEATYFNHTYPTDRAHNITCERALTTKEEILLYEYFTKIVTKLLCVYRWL